MEEKQYLKLRENDALNLIRLEDSLYKEGFSSEEIDKIIQKKIARLESKRFEEKQPSLKSIIIGCALGFSLGIGASYLISDCSSLDGAKIEHRHNRKYSPKTTSGGYGVE